MNILDLTQNIDEDTPVFPGSPNLKILQWSNYLSHDYNSEVIFTSTHIGTHLDAPIHFNQFGISVEKIPLERIIILNNARVLKIKKEDDECIDIEDLKEFEIKKKDTILIHTCWSSNRFINKYFEKNPGLSKTAAQYLSDLEINLIGIDSPSIDPAFDKKFSAHKILCAKNIPIIENLINLEKINKDNFTFIALPLKLKNLSGSPIRAIALID